MDLETLATIGTPIKWVGDRVLPADVKPRHIGRVVTADVLLVPDDPTNFDTVRVVGVLEGVYGSIFTIAGSDYEFDEMQNVRVWRREVAR